MEYLSLAIASIKKKKALVHPEQKRRKTKSDRINNERGGKKRTAVSHAQLVYQLMLSSFFCEIVLMCIDD